jgi:N6-adenosine-specific RNA methylase IME4/ParB-like chromosome segregation protein Spo0J
MTTNSQRPAATDINPGPPVGISEQAAAVVGDIEAASYAAGGGLQYVLPSEIHVGTRHRKELGDITALAVSIQQFGLLHPPVVTHDLRHIAGQRRLEAWRLIYGDNRPIPVRSINLLDIVHGEAAENFERKDFTPSEAVAIKRAIEPEIRQAARARIIAGGKLKAEAPAKLAEASKGDTRDKVAVFTGIKRTTLEKAEAIVEAAEAEPEKFGKLLEDMDRTGRVDGPFKRLQNTLQGQALRESPPPLPMRGPYNVIVSDWPAPAEPEGEVAEDRAYYPYPTMSVEAMKALPVSEIAATDATLWFFVTNFHLAQGLHVDIIRAWGFEPKTVLTWVKDKIGRGQRLRGKTEHVVLATRGKPVFNLTHESTELRAPRREHSRKPDEFYDLVERLCPAPRYAELFSRGGRGSKWDCHGDQVGTFGVAQQSTYPIATGPLSKTPPKTLKALIDAYLADMGADVDLRIKITLLNKVAPNAGTRSLKWVDSMTLNAIYGAAFPTRLRERTRPALREIRTAIDTVLLWGWQLGYCAKNRADEYRESAAADSTEMRALREHADRLQAAEAPR